MGDTDINTLIMEQYLALTRRNQAPGMVKPEIRGNIIFEIKSQFMRELREDTFSGSKNNDAHEHVERVLDIGPRRDGWTDYPQVPSTPRTCSIKPLFKGTVHHPKQPSSLRKSITSSKKEMRLCTMLRKGLDTMTRQSLVSQGPIPNKTPTQAWTAIQPMTDHSQKWHDESSIKKVSSSSNSDEIAAIISKLKGLGRDMKILNENAHAIQVGCQTCGGAHLDKEFPLNKEVKSVKEVKYGEFGRSFPNNRGNRAKYRVDLGASINVMPYSLFKSLQLTNLKETSMMVEMVDMTRKAPIRMVENVLVKIDKFVFPSDFMIIDMLGIGEDREPRVKRKEMAEILDSCPITSRWHIETLQWQRSVYGKVKNGMLKQWMCFWDNESGDQHRNPMLRTSLYFADFTQEVREEPRPRDFPYQILVSRRIIDPSHQEDLILSIKSYFLTSSSVNKDKPQPKNYSFEKWLKVKIGHTHVDESVKNVVLNEWILDIFDIEADFIGICNDPYSRSLYEYMSAFDNEIEQFANQYELRIGKKGYILDDIWEKCERVHEETPYPWHDGFKRSHPPLPTDSNQPLSILQTTPPPNRPEDH
ncbi:zinc knuckle CX2CX4HX4C containing protein [Tanacetum coccineum]|uniref:Zinc knuckle CX2CX4HX4C containing protein n=1 Tax=Tanacetum coccineum TaxID=301880 RepID=A0ABQ5ANJ3_9ASTR